MKVTSSKFFCTKCGNEGIPILRNQMREPGHLKRLYCLHCKEVINHAEVSEIGNKYTHEDFLEEFNNGRFVNGERVELYTCSNSACEFNKNGKCWECKNECPYKPQKGEL